MRGRCFKPSHHSSLRAIAFASCAFLLVGRSLLAFNGCWVGSRPQVVLAVESPSTSVSSSSQSVESSSSSVSSSHSPSSYEDPSSVASYFESTQGRALLSTFATWGGGSSGGGGADTEGKSYDDGPLWAAMKSFQDQINVMYRQIYLINTDSLVSLQNQIHDEASARDSGDKSLQKQIHDEADNRFSSDKSLQDQIHAEADNRFSTDKTLQDQIHSEADNRSLADKSLQDQIHSEADNRSSADKSLQDQIHAEADTRFSVDKGLQDQIHAVASVADSASKGVSALWESSEGLQSQITTTNGLVSSNTTSIDQLRLYQTSLSDKIDVLSSQVSDAVGTAAVVHAIDSVGSGVKDLQNNTWSLLSIVTDKIWPAIRDVKSLLDDVLQKILDKLISVDNQVNGFVGLFQKFRDEFSLFVLNIRQDIADFQKGVLTGLLAVSEWLKAIYYSIQNLPAPETSEIHLPTNDGGGGGSGTNIWDVLKQLIESLGTIVGKLVDALSKLADLVSQLFVPKDLSFISDTFDGISSKFDKKFAIFIDFGSSLKGLFSSRHALKDFSLSFAGASVVVPLSMVSALAGQMRPLLTGLFVLLTVTGVYRRFTDGEVVS
ncbi:hypothetical protein [Zymomonas mobilis]|uniref:hypothetical protein n=1 Tax=Zymomonas mobilis TaxID=542 RepID=UPI0039E7F16F